MDMTTGVMHTGVKEAARPEAKPKEAPQRKDRKPSFKAILDRLHGTKKKQEEPNMAGEVKQGDKKKTSGPIRILEPEAKEISGEVGWFRKFSAKNPTEQYRASTRLAAVVRNVTTDFVSGWLRSVATPHKVGPLLATASDALIELQKASKSSELGERIGSLATSINRQVEILKVIDGPEADTEKRQHVLRLQRELASAMAR